MVKNHKGKKGLPPSRKFNHDACGEVVISFNEENEVKTALVVPAGYHVRPDRILKALWKAYRAEKTREWRKSIADHFFKSAAGYKVMTPLNAEEKAKRIRTFQTVAKRHPSDTEIRVQDLSTMIKIALVVDEMLRRVEIEIRQDLPGLIGFDEIPGKYGNKLARDFNGEQQRFSGVQIESYREKMTVPMLFEWGNETFVIDYERAMDIGVSRSLAGHARDIHEYEGEVKRISQFDAYINRTPVNIKKNPSYADLSQDDIHDMIEAFLHERLEKFLEFTNNWLDMKYKGCTVVTVTHSKSQPEMTALHEFFSQIPKRDRDKAVERAAAMGTGFVVDKALDALRLQIAA